DSDDIDALLSLEEEEREECDEEKVSMTRIHGNYGSDSSSSCSSREIKVDFDDLQTLEIEIRGSFDRRSRRSQRLRDKVFFPDDDGGGEELSVALDSGVFEDGGVVIYGHDDHQEVGL
ncbi:hypothetical protein U1Q18_014929, partial [Sarracenia purpurea var. burkii]